jgi:hypothetical protein
MLRVLQVLYDKQPVFCGCNTESVKYIGSPFCLTAIIYCFLLAHLSYYGTLLSWQSNKVRMLHHYMSEFQYSEM